MRKSFTVILCLLTTGFVSAQAPSTPQIPQGTSTVCPNGTFTYTIPAVPGATFYLWKAPAGTLINVENQFPLSIPAPGGQSVSITFGIVSGTICVAAGNNHGISAYSCLNFTVTPLAPTILSPIGVCYEDLPFLPPFGGVITSPGTYQTESVLTSMHGCDSIIRQKINVYAPNVRNLSPIYTCTADTGCYNYYGLELCQEGVFKEVLTSFRGCDSIINGYFGRLPISVSILPNAPKLNCLNSPITLTAQTNFLNTSYTWKNGAGQVLGNSKTLIVNTPGTYQIFLKGISSSCVDSASVVIDNPNPFVNIVALAPANPDCQSPKTILQTSATPANVVYAWGGTLGYTSSLQNPVVTTTGTYTVTVTNTSTGCTSTKAIEVVSETRRDTITASVCTGESYAGYTQSGTYVDTLVTHPCGCYDIRVLTIDTISVRTKDIDVQICPGQQYNGYMQSGTYQDLYNTPGGCDSLRILHLTVAPSYTVKPIVQPDRGTGTGSATLQITGGQAPFLFTWSSGAVEQNLYNLPAGFYAVTVNDALGCSNVLAVKVPFELDSVPPIHPASGIVLFPNPVQNRLWITLPPGTSGQISLFDVLGNQRLPARKCVAGTSWMDMENLVSGTYFVVIEGLEPGTLVRKVLIYR